MSLRVVATNPERRQMGMVCTLKRVSASEVDQVVASPSAALALIADDADRAYPLEEVRPPGCLGFLLRLTPITVTQVAQRPTGDIDEPLLSDPDRMEIEVWDVINFLLTGSATEGELPASFLVRGGTELDTEDDEIFLRLLTPETVSEIDHYLRSISSDDLRARIDIPRMVKARVISEPRKKEDSSRSDEYFESVLREFDELKRFIAETKQKGSGLLVNLN